MVERSLSMREVRGSIPRCSNSFLDFFPLRRPPRWEVCCWSRGLLAHSDVRATGNGADRAIAARGREARVYIHRSPPRASRSRQMSVRARVLRAVLPFLEPASRFFPVEIGVIRPPSLVPRRASVDPSGELLRKTFYAWLLMSAGRPE